MYDRTTKLEDTLEKCMQASLTNKKNTEASIRNLGTQVGQLAKQLSHQHAGQFSANTHTNPKEHCKSITTRSDKIVGRGIGDNLGVEEEVLEGKKRENEKKNECEGEEEQNKREFVNKREEKEEKNISEEKKKEKGEKQVPQLKSLPYPQTPSKKDKERQFSRFMDIFKRLQINIPFVEAMEQMPTYAKFMKELLTKKRRFSEETVEVEAGCNAIIQKSLPQKSKDLWSFTILVTIGTLPVGKALFDLGASINLMPLSMLRRI